MPQKRPVERQQSKRERELGDSLSTHGARWSPSPLATPPCLMHIRLTQTARGSLTRANVVPAGVRGKRLQREANACPVFRPTQQKRPVEQINSVHGVKNRDTHRHASPTARPSYLRRRSRLLKVSGVRDTKNTEMHCLRLACDPIQPHAHRYRRAPRSTPPLAGTRPSYVSRRRGLLDFSGVREIKNRETHCRRPRPASRASPASGTTVHARCCAAAQHVPVLPIQHKQAC